jgi:hypothetical protein
MYYLLFAIALVMLFGLLYFFSKRKEKPAKGAPAFLFVIVLLLMLVILLAKYSQERPYTFLAVGSNVILSIITVGLFSFLLWPLKESSVFVADRRVAIRRFLVIFFVYSLYFIIINRGLSFVFNGLINPQAISLTPEFERYAIPTLSGLILVIYRLTQIFRSKVTEFLGEVSQDVIVFSLLMFWLSIVTSFTGVTIVSDVLPISVEQGFWLGFFFGIIALVFEGFLVWIRNGLVRYRGKFSFEEIVFSFYSQLSPKGRMRQTTLGEFQVQRVASKPTSELDKVIQRLDSRLSLKYRGRVLKLSSVVRFVTVVALILAVGGMFLAIIPRDVVVLAPAFSVEISIISRDQLPQSATVIMSEGVEGLDIGNLYAVPVASIRSANISFDAPLSSRYVSLNSSTFTVVETNEYLTLRLKKIYVETHISQPRITSYVYDHRNDVSFGYIGFFREAEIFYCLAKFGYNQTTTLSTSSLQGFITVAQKFIYSSNGSGGSVLVFIERRSETATLGDSTTVTSLNADLMNQMIFLISQTKSNTVTTMQIVNPSSPFRFVDTVQKVPQVQRVNNLYSPEKT